MRRNLFLILFFSIIIIIFLNGQAKKSWNVAIFLNQGVEVLDFSGPSEVFSLAPDFNVYTVASKDELIESQGFIDIKPDYTIENCPDPDIVFIGGGGTGRLLRDKEAMEWFSKISENPERIMFSVCTGAAVLAQIGILDGKKATTHHSALNRLKQTASNCEVLENTRFVDNGNVITTAGVSAGIDGALHLVSKLKGLESAKNIAIYMEYDKWVPEEGFIVEAPFISLVQKHGFNKAVKQYQTAQKGDPVLQLYVGDMVRYSESLIDKGQNEKAVQVMEFSTEIFPSYPSYAALGKAYHKINKVAPPSFQEIKDLILKNQVSEVVSIWKAAKSQYPNWILWTERDMNTEALQLFIRKNPEGAVQLLKLNIEAYPKSPDVYFYLAEVYNRLGEKSSAKEYYEQTLKVDPGYQNAQKRLEALNKS